MNDINFLPERYIGLLQKRQRIYQEIILVCCIVVGLFLWALNSHASLASLKNYAEVCQTQSQATTQQTEELDKLCFVQQNLIRRERLCNQLAMPIDYSQICAMLADLMPRTLTVKNLTMIKHAPLDMGNVSNDLIHPQGHFNSVNEKTNEASKVLAKAALEPRIIRVDLAGVAPSDVDVTDFVWKLTQSPVFQNVKMKYTRSTRVGNYFAREFRVELIVSLDDRYKHVSEKSEIKEVTYAN